MVYKSNVKQFSMEPPLKRRRFRVDQGMVVAWVLVYRLPYFMKSHLYLEYRFALELLTGKMFCVNTRFV